MACAEEVTLARDNNHARARVAVVVVDDLEELQVNVRAPGVHARTLVQSDHHDPVVVLLHDHGAVLDSVLRRLGYLGVGLVGAWWTHWKLQSVGGQPHDRDVGVEGCPAGRLARAEGPHTRIVIGVVLVEAAVGEDIGDIVCLVEGPVGQRVGLPLDDGHGVGGGEDRELRGKLQGLLENVLGFADPLHEARWQPLRRQRLTPQEQQLGVARADELRQHVGGVILGDAPSLHEASTDLRARRSEAEVTGQREAEARTAAVPVDAGDDGHVHLADVAEAADAQLLCLGRCRARPLPGKVLATARDHNCADPILDLQTAQGLEKLSVEVGAPGVGSVRRAQRHLHHPVVVGLQDQGASGVGSQGRRLTLHFL
mmetsp:Transcript_19371/g.58302  ORF Transcript_19371/g.58302 Transcript_19371/m.58302 type:complete len:370 (-) Transcript_19371:137-1246(-)